MLECRGTYLHLVHAGNPAWMSWLLLPVGVPYVDGMIITRSRCAKPPNPHPSSRPARMASDGPADVPTTCLALAAAGVVVYLGPVVTEERCRCAIPTSEWVDTISIEGDYMLRHIEGEGELADRHYIRRWRTSIGDESSKCGSQAVGLEPQQCVLEMEEEAAGIFTT
ncbi:hypothetical protein LZ31DRAFT_368427 [Colletotrichum somersetense]|nr:hypothetical protein LZ31DRAFT_368427 [Colletotrichum somersetense]